MTEDDALRLAHSYEGQRIMRLVKLTQDTGNMPSENVNFASVMQLAVWGYIHMQEGVVSLTIKGTKELRE